MRDYALTGGIVVALVVLALVLRGREAGLPPTPEETISAFFDAAKQGDVDTYLRLTSDELRKSLEATRSELGDTAFRENIKRSATGIKGIAVIPGGAAPSGYVARDVELVFVDRNEKQELLLAEERGGWAIASMSEASVSKPLIPYGTPVFEGIGQAGGQNQTDDARNPTEDSPSPP